MSGVERIHVYVEDMRLLRWLTSNQPALTRVRGYMVLHCGIAHNVWLLIPPYVRSIEATAYDNRPARRRFPKAAP